VARWMMRREALPPQQRHRQQQWQERAVSWQSCHCRQEMPRHRFSAMETSTVLVLLLTGVMSLAGIVASTRALVHDGYRATPTRTSGPAFARDLERTSVR
jgi:hypothetical protein